MSSSGTQPYNYVESTGIIVPDTSEIISDVQGEFVIALGADLSLDPETPQGVIMTAEELFRAGMVANNAEVANQINPNYAGGVCLAAICALTGFDPPAATATIVNGVSVTGQPLAPLPAGSQAKTAAGDIFQTTTSIAFDSSGNGEVDFESIQLGPIPCAANVLVTIVTEVLGWETVNNTGAGVIGVSPPSDMTVRALRQKTLALQGSTLAQSVLAGLYDPNTTPGVTSAKFLENKANTTQTISGISLVANSAWACVNGGTDLAVATTLLGRVSGGCNFNGATSVNVTDPASGQIYDVLFDRPTAVPVGVRVTAVLPNPVTSANIQQAVADYAAGLVEGQPGFVVGGDVSPFDIGAGIWSEFNNVYIRKVEVTLTPSSPAYQTTEIPIALNQIATLAFNNIVIVPVTY
jgi:hypothetical protein